MKPLSHAQRDDFMLHIRVQFLTQLVYGTCTISQVMYLKGKSWPLLSNPEEASVCRLRHEVNNEYRLLRMVEILLSSGRPLSELNHDRSANLDYDFRCFFLNRPRLELYDRIGLRCEQMVVGGILQAKPLSLC